MNNQKIVLLIDDDILLQTIYQKELELSEVKTDTAATGEKGLEMSRQKKYDMILLDAVLPDMESARILADIKLPEHINYKTPVVMLTGLEDEEFQKKIESLGVMKYLVKSSLSPQAMADEIKNLLTRLSEKS